MLVEEGSPTDETSAGGPNSQRTYSGVQVPEANLLKFESVSRETTRSVLPLLSTLVPQAYCPKGCWLQMSRSPPLAPGHEKLGAPYWACTSCKEAPAGRSAMLVQAAVRTPARTMPASFTVRLTMMILSGIIPTSLCAGRILWRTNRARCCVFIVICLITSRQGSSALSHVI